MNNITIDADFEEVDKNINVDLPTSMKAEDSATSAKAISDFIKANKGMLKEAASKSKSKFTKPSAKNRKLKHRAIEKNRRKINKQMRRKK